MDEFFKWLSSNPIATTALIVAFGVLVTSVTLIYLVAFFQGREISFWPPKIGTRSTKSLSELEDTVGKIQHTGYQPATRKKETVTITPSLSQEIVQLPSKCKPVEVSSSVKLDLDSMSVLEVVSQTDHSIIEKCVIQGTPYILKRTDRSLCQEQALKDLVGHKISGSEGGASVVIATPIALWITDEHVWELYQYYNGLSLHKLIMCNKYEVQGDYLGIVYNSIFEAVNHLHKINILHRDINPTNFLMMESGDLVLLDSTFCCKRESAQIPVENKVYSPPEQALGQATIKSDWYSIAATIYFLANGEPPDQNDVESFTAGLAKINTGCYLSLTYGRAANLLEALLNKSVSKRPKNFYEATMTAGTHPVGFSNVLGILDLGQFGYLVTQHFDHRVLTPDEMNYFLREAAEHDAIENPELKKDVAAFSQGLTPWLVES